MGHKRLGSCDVLRWTLSTDSLRGFIASRSVATGTKGQFCLLVLTYWYAADGRSACGLGALAHANRLRAFSHHRFVLHSATANYSVGALYSSFCFRTLSLTVRFLPLFLVYPIAMHWERTERWWWTWLLFSLQHAGPTLIKLGQWASTRRDIFSKAFCDKVGVYLVTNNYCLSFSSPSFTRRPSRPATFATARRPWTRSSARDSWRSTRRRSSSISSPTLLVQDASRRYGLFVDSICRSTKRPSTSKNSRRRPAFESVSSTARSMSISPSRSLLSCILYASGGRTRCAGADFTRPRRDSCFHQMGDHPCPVAQVRRPSRRCGAIRTRSSPPS